MDKASFEENFRYEQDYWWYVGRRKIVFSLIDRFYVKKRESIALDAGCGTGITLENLEKYAVTIGSDISELALSYTRRRKFKNLVRGDLCDLPFKDNVFDLITILGVLYNKYIADDQRALQESFRVLKKGGIAVIDEAAYNFLQSKHNESVGGVRRYTRGQLVSMARICGFKVLKASYWNVLMLPLFLLMVKLEHWFGGQRGAARPGRIPSILNNMLKRYIYMESLLMKYISLPFGSSIILVAEKE